MNAIKIDYTVVTHKSFDDAVNSVMEETAKAGFRVLYVHDVKETLGKKNFIIDPLKIIEICNAKNAYNVIKIDINLALCLPCKINVYARDGKTFISGMTPLVMTRIFPSVDLGTIPYEVDKAMREIIDRASRAKHE